MKKNISTLAHTRRFASFVLAAAISEIFPKAKFLGGDGTSFGFYYDFVIDVKKEQFSFIEETMANLLKNEEVRAFHMTAQNAKEFLQHFGFSTLAKDINSSFVDLLQIGGFIDFQKEPPQKDLLFFKIFDIEETDGKTRILGALFENLQDLKNFLKKQKKHKTTSHLAIAEDMGLYYFFEDIWSFKGIELKNLVLNFFISELKKENFFFVQSVNAQNISFLLEREKRFLNLPLKLAQSKETQREANDFLNPPSGFFALNNVLTLSEYILCEKELVLEEVISSLNFFLKILKIFDFSFKVVFCEKPETKNKERKIKEIFEKALQKTCAYEVLEGSDSIEIWIEDSRGFYHKAFFLSMEPLKEKMLLKRRAIVEDFIALLLEKTSGNLPMRLSPEWVRIVTVNNSCASWAKEIKEICEKNSIRALIDESFQPLSEKIKAALTARVAFIAVVGEKEKEAKTVTLRGQKIEEVSIENLLNKLKMEII